MYRYVCSTYFDVVFVFDRCTVAKPASQCTGTWYICSTYLGVVFVFDSCTVVGPSSQCTGTYAVHTLMLCLCLIVVLLPALRPSVLPLHNNLKTKHQHQNK